MNVKEITVSRQVTINLGNYSSAKFEVTLTADTKSDDSADVHTRLGELVNDLLWKDVNETLGKTRFTGLDSWKRFFNKE